MAGLRLTTAMGALIAAAVISAPMGYADNVDPHVPNGSALWCQGGLGNTMLQPYCNGAPYADGTSWHQSGHLVPFASPVFDAPVCVAATGEPAHGGCGGAG
jgi:hypothetical protein